jgi:2-phosphosulfolactate phosphatase
MAAKMLYEHTRHDLFGFLKNSSHYHRLSRLGIEKDIEYCLRENVVDAVGIIRNGELVKA